MTVTDTSPITAVQHDHPLAMPPARLRFEQTVPRELVHRHSVAEVFVTDSVLADDGSAYVAVQIPRGHLINRSRDSVDETLIVETLRQASICVAHTVLNVPHDMVFVFNRMTLAVTDASLLRFAGNQISFVIVLKPECVRLPNGRPTRMTFQGTLLVDGRLALEGTGAASLVPKRAWPKIRGRAAAVAEPTEQPDGSVPCAGAPLDKLLHDIRREADGSHSAAVFVDPTHSFYFDHPLDHVPAVLQVDALLQFTRYLAQGRPSTRESAPRLRGLNLDFTGFAELDRCTRIWASEEPSEHGEPDSIRFIAQVRQGSEVAARAEVTFSPASHTTGQSVSS